MIELVIANPQLRDMEALIMSIQTACKTIASVIEVRQNCGFNGYILFAYIDMFLVRGRRLRASRGWREL